MVIKALLRPALLLLARPQLPAQRADLSSVVASEFFPNDAVNASLSSRIAQLEAAEARQYGGLLERMQDLRAADRREAGLERYGSLPVVCCEPLLPGQRMDIVTDDPVFSSLLTMLGLGVRQAGFDLSLHLSLLATLPRRALAPLRCLLAQPGVLRDRDSRPTGPLRDDVAHAAATDPAARRGGSDRPGGRTP
jgi:hypothetical protein